MRLYSFFVFCLVHPWDLLGILVDCIFYDTNHGLALYFVLSVYCYLTLRLLFNFLVTLCLPNCQDKVESLESFL